MNSHKSIGHSDQVMLDLRVYRDTKTITKLTAFENGLDVTWMDGEESRYFYAWFRENCGCKECRNVFTLERKIDPLDVPFDIKPTGWDNNNGTELTFTWQDGHRSSFPSSWLWFHAANNPRNVQPSFVTKSQNRELPEAAPLSEMTYEAYMNDDASFLWGINQILDNGSLFITGVPCEEDAIIPFASRISFLRQTHYGSTFQVRSVPNPISVAYTNEKLISHTDLPNFENPPGIQFFHCITNDANGGESVLVDGYAVAERLKKDNPHHFKALTENPLSFRLQDKDNDRFNCDPVIELDNYGHLKRIRYSRANLSPYVGSPETYQKVREAFLEFTRLVESPEFENVLKLKPGEMLITDNERVLHGRLGFDLGTGDRHLQGCYLDRADLRSRKAVLERNVDNLHRKKL
jgi:gamma-butyrobetaine dioxygenase